MLKLAESLNKISSLEELAENKSVVHSLHPMAKLITTLVFLVMVISFNKYNISGLIPFFIYPILMMSLGDIPFGSVLSRLLAALPFSFFAGLSNLFLDRAVAFYWGAIPVSYGVLSFSSIILKTVLTVMAVLILIAATSMDRIACQLIRLRVPRIFVIQLMLTYRYLSVLITEALNMATAYHLRSARQKGIKIIHIGSFLGQLLLRSFDRAERIYYAMKLRGFSGDYRFAQSGRLNGKDIAYTVILSLAFILMRYFNISLLIGNAFY